MVRQDQNRRHHGLPYPDDAGKQQGSQYRQHRHHRRHHRLLRCGVFLRQPRSLQRG